MNKAEMTEIFAVLMVAYPQAEMFKAESQQALREKLAPTISLWTTCLKDIDFWTAKQAVIRVCQNCRFPPTIAEMREAAENVKHQVKSEIEWAYMAARNEVKLLTDGEGLNDAYSHMTPRSRKVIDAMGGMEAFLPPDKHFFNMEGFEQTYERLLRSNPVGLPGETVGQKKLN